MMRIFGCGGYFFFGIFELGVILRIGYFFDELICKVSWSFCVVFIKVRKDRVIFESYFFFNLRKF